MGTPGPEEARKPARDHPAMVPRRLGTTRPRAPPPHPDNVAGTDRLSSKWPQTPFLMLLVGGLLVILFSSLKSLFLLLACSCRGNEINKIVGNVCRPRERGGAARQPEICLRVVSETASGETDLVAERLCSWRAPHSRPGPSGDPHGCQQQLTGVRCSLGRSPSV